ncbi:MAG TPA: gluconate 2-dehydrogenase subunit 3 family protein, partial [Ktedonobacterales bacterium]|nr:gluconate 2-dehydrogenase subunit 3 family protein [Ktedonobacterales bacterium]
MTTRDQRRQQDNEQTGKLIGGVPAERLPRDPRTGQALAPRMQPGYYPGFSTLSQQAFWDEATRNVVLKRVEQVPPITFFSPDEARVMQAVCDRVLPQDDRAPERCIPILHHIDERLASGRINGYRYDDMPPDQQAYQLAIKGIEAIAQAMGAPTFTALSLRDQDEALKSLHDGKPIAGDDIWRQVNVRRFWLMLVTDCAAAYYAHPWAWD